MALTATFNSSTSGTLVSASALPAFDPSANSLAYVGTATAGSYVCAIGSATQILDIGAINTADFWAGVNGITRSADSGVTNSTRRLVLAKMVGTTLNVEAPTHIAVAAASGAPTSVSGTITFGFNVGSTTASTGVARALLVLAGAYTTGQRDTLAAWAVASHSAVLA